MNKSPQSVRAMLIIGASILLILLLGALVKYELVMNSILYWIEGLKPAK